MILVKVEGIYQYENAYHFKIIWENVLEYLCKFLEYLIPATLNFISYL